MKNMKVEQKIVDRFNELKEIGYQNLDGTQRKEYSELKNTIMSNDPSLLEGAPRESKKTTESPEIQEESENEEMPENENGLSEEENARLLELNAKSDRTKQEDREREGLRGKVRNYKMSQIKRTNHVEQEVQLGDDLLKELAWVVSVISQAVSPQVFKDVSAANLDMKTIKTMHAKAKLINQKLNG